MGLRNVTLSIPEELLRRAKVAAARRDTSVSAMVVELLQSSVGATERDDALWDEEERVMDSGILRIGPVRWMRDELHDRRRG